VVGEVVRAGRRRNDILAVGCGRCDVLLSDSTLAPSDRDVPGVELVPPINFSK